MKKLYIPIIAALLFAAIGMQAQSRTSLLYSIGFGTGDLGDYISQPSWRGVTLDFKQMVSENMGVGLSVGWNVFYEEVEYDTYTLETVSLSGKQWRYSNHFPMLAMFDYYMTQGQRINPFIGLGTGVIYTRRNTDMNLYTLEQEAWNFALQPEIGIEIDNNVSSAFTIVAKYYNGFAAGDFEDPQSYIALCVGWTFKN